MRRLAAAVCAVLVIAGCTSSGSRPTTSPRTSSAPAPSSSAIDATISAKAFVAKLSSLTSLTSAQVAASTRVAGQSIIGRGAERLTDGAIVAADLTQALPGGLGDIRVIRSAGQTYAKLPDSLVKTTKPWQVLSAANSNPVVSQVSQIVDTILAVASPSSLVAFAEASTSIRELSDVHYSLTVDPAKLPPDLAGLGSDGTIMIEVFLDPQNRPARVDGEFSLAGQTIDATIMLSGFNEPVSIVAPPPGQVSSK